MLLEGPSREELLVKAERNDSRMAGGGGMVEEDGRSGVNRVGESMSEVFGLETVLPRRLSPIE